MSWLSKIRSEPTGKKIRLLWIATGICAALLILFWVLIGNYNPRHAKDTSLFQTLGTGLKNFSQQNYTQQGQQAAQQAEQLNSK